MTLDQDCPLYKSCEQEQNDQATADESAMHETDWALATRGLNTNYSLQPNKVFYKLFFNFKFCGEQIKVDVIWSHFDELFSGHFWQKLK